MEKPTPRFRRFAVCATALAGVALLRYAFATRDRPPLYLRLAARRVLSDGLDAPIKRVLESADRHYALLAPAITGARTAAGRMNLRMSAYLLALFRAMRDEGIAEDRATTLIADGLFRVMRRVWQVPDAIVDRLAPDDRLARVRMRQRLARKLYFREPDWSMHEVPVEDGYGVDVTRCVMRDFLAAQGAAKLCEDVLCRQDTLTADARGDRLTRTATLAGGAERCDFRFT